MIQSTRDEELASLLAAISEQQRKGLTPDIEAIIRQHPDLGEELRSLWATAQFAAVFARPVPSLISTFPKASLPVDNIVALPRIFGEFELLEELGRGGMGVVYKARQPSLHRFVAIKMMRDARLSSETDRKRFSIEASSAAKLKHPNIVTVHEVGEHEQQLFFVMEFVEGKTLGQQVAANGPMPPREAARLVALIADAVQHAHEHGILHRDLKPANVMIAPGSADSSSNGARGEVVKVTDFGLAKRFAVSASSADIRTQTGAIVGTPSYMAPEQAGARKDLSPATDVYSLGAILYELLTGRPPFLASNPVDTLLMVIEQEPVSPRRFDPAIDRDLELICLKCLQKSPELRYASAANLASDLRAYLSGEQVSSQPSGLRYFLARMLRETHHAGVLENWGVLWMWHSLAIFVLCFLTQIMAWSNIQDHRAYLILWSVGLIAWGSILWQLRRRAGPVLFVERQLAHAWAAGVCASIAMFVIEVSIGLRVLTLSPAIAVAAGMIFVFKAGILSGRFYMTAVCLFVTACVMPLLPGVEILLFGVAAALSFFIPGLKYYRLRKKSLQALE